MPSAFDIDLDRKWARVHHRYANPVIRCPALDCDEPTCGIWVSTPTTLYIDDKGHLQDQADLEWSDHDTAGCSHCGEQATVQDFQFYRDDFLLYPRDPDDLNLKEKS